MINIFQIMGILGLILITIGITLRRRKTEDIVYIIGGLCLVVYSIHIRDVIFIILQTVFILVATYNLIKISRKKKSKKK